MRFFRLLRFLMVSRRQFGRLPVLAASSRVPLRLKLMALAAGILILSPLNILGDIPLLGIADDVALLGMLLGWFVRTAEGYDAVETIDGSFLAKF